MNTIKFDKKNTLIVAHRGLSGLERENTCPAFVAAANRSYFGIETDIHVTKDGQFVVIHDETTKRVSLGEYEINVEEADYSELENIILPDIDGNKSRSDIRIPLLKDYISICKKYNKVSVLEIKNYFTFISINKEAELKAKLQAKLDEYIVEKERIEDYIENIEDAEVRVIARKRFIENKDYQTIGDEMYIDRTTAYKKLKRYFERTEEEWPNLKY